MGNKTLRACSQNEQTEKNKTLRASSQNEQTETNKTLRKEKNTQQRLTQKYPTAQTAGKYDGTKENSTKVTIIIGIIKRRREKKKAEEADWQVKEKAENTLNHVIGGRDDHGGRGEKSRKGQRKVTYRNKQSK